MHQGSELRELSAQRFTAELGALTGIYGAAMNAPASQLPDRRAMMERHTGYPSFRAVVVRLAPGSQRPWPSHATARPPEGPAIAFAYGFHGDRGQWWHDLVSDHLRAAGRPEAVTRWLADSFEVAEVHVLPAYQGRGIGREMMHRLTAGRPERTAVLSTPQGRTRASRLYRSLGFTDLLTDFRFPGTGQPYAIMGAALPLRDRAEPASRSASPSRW